MTLTIKGLAYRAGSQPDEYPAEWSVPERLPLTMSFDANLRIGIATLTHLHRGDIWVSCEVAPPADWPVDDFARALAGLRFFAVGVVMSPVTQRGGDEPDGRVFSLAVVDRNVDPSLPPYTVEGALVRPE